MNHTHLQDVFTPEEIAQLKTVWRTDRQKQGWSFICPLCHLTRKVSNHPRPQPRHFAQILLTSAFFTVLTWKLFEWKGLVSFIPFWCIFEVIYRTRARAALYCKSCGFDPYLFLRDTDLAKQQVDTHWRKKFEEKGVPYPHHPEQAGKNRATLSDRTRTEGRL